MPPAPDWSEQIALFASVSPDKSDLRLGRGTSWFEFRDQRLQLFGRIGVGLCEFKQNLGVGNTGLEILLLLQRLFDTASLLNDLLGLLLIVPEIRLGYLFF